MPANRLKELLKYISLGVIGTVGLSLYFVVDTIFIARALGQQGLAALNFALPIFGLTHATGLMIGIGGAIRYNYHKTKKEQNKANHVFSAAIVLAGIFSLVFIILGIFYYKDVSQFLGAQRNATVFYMTSQYVRILLLLSPIYLLNNILIAFVRNDGAPSMAMGGMVISSVSNIFFDYLLLFVIPLGMLGAALATSIAAFSGVVYLAFFFVLKKNTVQLGSIDKIYLLWPTILLLGLPASLINLMYSAVMSLFNRIIDGLIGTVGVAAYSIIANLSLISVAVLIGVSQGVQPLLTRAFSRQKMNRLRKTLVITIFVTIGLSSFVYTLFWISGDSIVGVFNRDNDITLQKMTVEGIRIYFIGFLFAGINIVYASFYSAIERPRIGVFIMGCRGILFIVPLAVILSQFFGILGLWFSFIIAEVLTLIISLIFYKMKFHYS